VVDVVVHRQLGEHIAGEEFAVARDLLAAADLGDLLGRDLDRFDERGQAEPGGLGHDRVADLVLEARISVDDVPAGHCAS
jgi:methyl coenzyme M reductase alpha subunit